VAEECGVGRENWLLQCDELPPEHVVYIPCYRGLKCIRLLKSVRLSVPITRPASPP
jgi:hypothetical protein